jgi:hypothetical protein
MQTVGIFGGQMVHSVPTLPSHQTQTPLYPAGQITDEESCYSQLGFVLPSNQPQWNVSWRDFSQLELLPAQESQTLSGVFWSWTDEI